jgi:polyisoprenoid-binding protein YceI
MKTNIFKTGVLALVLLACQTAGKKETIETVDLTKKEQSNGSNFAGGSKPSNRLLPDKLRELPMAIVAGHFPNPCYAELEEGMYVWKHNTTIMANEDLQIVEYGSFVYTEKGWYLRVTMTPKEFSENYNCPSAILKKGIIYTDCKSWRRSDSLYAGDAMWYYIAKDKNGKLVKGIAPIETEGKLLEASKNQSNILNSEITWTRYSEIGNYSLTGKVKLKEGTVTFSGDTVKAAQIVIDLNTMTHEENNLVEHLKGADFFEVAKFPFAELQINTIDNSNIKQPKLSAAITIKGITKVIQFPVNIMGGVNSKIIKGKINIDRTTFGIKYNSKSFFSNLGDQAIKNNFDLVFEVEVR